MKLFTNPVAKCIIGSDKNVLYACQCKEFKPISKLYFCRHCTKLRCGSCVAHEVDSFYCPNCLENMPSAEAKLKKNRCANCFDCPSCGNTLSVRATAVPASIPNPSDDAQKVTPIKKMHYLNCGFCRWTTRDVGLPDQVTPSGGWPESDPPFAKKISALLDYYKHLAHQDKMEKERQKISRRRTNMYLMDRYGYALSLGKKRSGSSGSPMSSSLLTKTGSQKEIQAPTLSTQLDDIEPIQDSFYTQPVVIEQALTLDQRLKQLETQESNSLALYPKHKHLMVRRSQRCKECEHNLCKPEFNPSSIKFKIQLGGMYYCPYLQISNKDIFQKEKTSEVILSLTNPLDTIMNIRFDNLNEDDDYYKVQNSQILLPSVKIPIAAKDATVEFDGIGTSNTALFDDDPSVIHSRSSNKVSFVTKVKPISLEDDQDILAFFKMTYEYKMITAPILRKLDDASEKSNKPEEHVVSLTVLVRLNLGKVQ